MPGFFLSFANANWVPHFGLFRFLLVRLVLCLVHRNLTVITIYIEHRGSRSSRPITHSYCLSGPASPFFFFQGSRLGWASKWSLTRLLTMGRPILSRMEKCDDWMTTEAPRQNKGRGLVTPTREQYQVCASGGLEWRHWHLDRIKGKAWCTEIPQEY